METLFELSAEYDEMLHRGLSLSGENKTYFLHGRVSDLKAQLSGKSIRRILDFGCGIGESSAHLAAVFKDAEIVGTDTAVAAIEYARSRYASSRIRFDLLDEFNEQETFDLCYVNGVFHHINPEHRNQALDVIKNALKPGGFFTLFENNPLNPGTRLIMSKIPFDRDAKTIFPYACREMIISGGFSEIITTRYLFYFPKSLKWLRFLEPLLVHLPLGGQYYILSVK